MPAVHAPAPPRSLALAALLLVGALASSPAAYAAPQGGPEIPILQAGDQLIVIIADPKPREMKVEVGLEGRIQLGIYGEVKVDGLRIREAQAVIARALKRYLKKTAGLSVVLAERKKLLLVSGKVKKPGLVRVAPKADLWQAVQAAGGAADGADLTRVVLGRRGSEETVNLQAYLTRERTGPLPMVQVGDVIFVPADAVVPSGQGGGSRAAYLSDAVVRNKVFVLGEVRKPSLLDLSPGLTPLTAIAMSGGPTGNADLASVRLITPKDSQAVDLRAHMLDPSLALPTFPKQVGSILFVPNRADPMGEHVQVVGQVTRPGPVSVAGPIDLVTALSHAGGPSKDGDIDDVMVVQSGRGFSLSAEYDVERFLEQGGVVAQVRVGPGDAVYVGDSTATAWRVTLQFISDLAIISASVAFFASIAR